MRYLVLLALLLASPAAAGIGGQAVRQPTNWTAIAMFAVFAGLTLLVTRWAAGHTRTASDF